MPRRNANPAESIGQMKWPIRIVTQIQEPGVDTGVLETYTNERRMFAAIEAVSGATYYLGQQIAGNEVTHKIVVRWSSLVDHPDKLTFVYRDVVIGGGSRTEEYRVRNWQDTTGARRFVTMYVVMVSTGE